MQQLKDIAVLIVAVLYIWFLKIQRDFMVMLAIVAVTFLLHYLVDKYHVDPDQHDDGGVL